MEKSEVQQLAREGLYHGNRLNASLEETHISWILLTRKLVFKIKKPVMFSFLDFSTPDLRRQFCEKELQLNRRFSTIYLDVLRISRQNGHWILDETSDNPLDYAVKMERLNSDRRMDILLRKDSVTASDISNLAAEVIRIHKESMPVRDEMQEDYFVKAFNDLAQVASHFNDKIQSLIADAISMNSQVVKQLMPRIRVRISSGWRRDVHGDLHSGNIFIDPRPVIFDGIEFNDSMRYLDVLDEVAFLCMDFEFFGRHRLSDQFIREYQTGSDALSCDDDWRLFHYFKAYRANVRAKVHALRARQSTSEETRKQEYATAVKYLHLMHHYAFP